MWLAEIGLNRGLAGRALSGLVRSRHKRTVRDWQSTQADNPAPTPWLPPSRKCADMIRSLTERVGLGLDQAA